MSEKERGAFYSAYIYGKLENSLKYEGNYYRRPYWRD